MIRIGIPRALLYYQYFPAWKTFFEELGAELVISSPTTRDMLTEGSARVVADTCLPVKVFLGHVLSLADECDCLFIPAIRSVQSRVYNCSKFLGLPDMTRAVIPESPPILEIEIDINRGKGRLHKAIYDLGRNFTWNPVKVRRAGQAAWHTYLAYRGIMSGQKLTPPEAIERMTGSQEIELKPDFNHPVSPSATIAVIGHPYLLYDEYINHRLIHRLEKTGSRIVTPEMPAVYELESALRRLSGRAYWTYEGEVVGAGGHYLQNEADGIIGIMAFGCGPDSLMMDTVRRQAVRSGSIPFTCITVDEHTAEAGIVTRLEAFVDMMQRKVKVEVCV